MRTISQRELRNSSGEIVRGLGRGESYRLTSRGVVVGLVTPVTRTALDELTLREGDQDMTFSAGVRHQENTAEVLRELRGGR